MVTVYESVGGESQRQGHQDLIGADIQFFRKQAHGHGRDDKGKDDGQQAEEIAQAGLVVKKKGGEEKPAGDEQENGDDDIRDRCDKIAFQFLAEDMANIFHLSSPWSIL
jgi:uncharacterized protein YehS (DUF1456 family)